MIATSTSESTSDAALIPPGDSCGLHALQRLAREGGATIHHGSIALAGTPRPAWLACARDGRLLAAVLTGDANARHELARTRVTSDQEVSQP